MTDEQIKQNAGAFIEESHYSKLDLMDGHWNNSFDSVDIEEAYIAGAHSRDEEIEELNGQVTLHKERADYYHDLYMKLRNPWRDAKKDPPKKELDGQACEFVLVPYENEVREVRYYFYTGTFEKGFLGTSEEEVIYPKVWMPMPETPKGGEV